MRKKVGHQDGCRWVLVCATGDRGLFIFKICSRLFFALFPFPIDTGTLKGNRRPVLYIRNGFNADPAPAFCLNVDPDPGNRTNADPDPSQSLKSQKVDFFIKKYS
jgi:hypothetical protein